MGVEEVRLFLNWVLFVMKTDPVLLILMPVDSSLCYSPGNAQFLVIHKNKAPIPV